MNVAKDYSEARAVGDKGILEPMEPPSNETAKSAPRRIGDIIKPALERMGKRARGEEKPIPMPQGWEPLADALHGGWWPNEQYILVGNTGHGKTGFALQAALHAALKGSPVLYVPLELDDTQLVARLLANETRQRWSSLLYGSKDAHAVATESSSSFESIPLYIPSPGPLRDLETEVKYVRNEEGNDKPMLVVLDFLQLVNMGGMDLRESIRTAAYQGTHIAREHNAAVLMLSSTSREHYATLDARMRQEKDKRSDIGEADPSSLVGVGKESGEIEYAASNLLVLCRDKAGERWLAIAKSRAGQTEWIRCHFDGSMGTFKLSPVEDKRESVEITPKKQPNVRLSNGINLR